MQDRHGLVAGVSRCLRGHPQGPLKRTCTARWYHAALVIVAVLVTIAAGQMRAASSPVGVYLDPLVPDNILEIESDGTFYIELLGLNIGQTGRWTTRDQHVSLRFQDGTVLRGSLEAEAIVFDPVPMLSMVWIKTTKRRPVPADVAGTYIKQGEPEAQLNIEWRGTYTKQEEDLFGQIAAEEGDWEVDGHVVRFMPHGDLYGIDTEAAYLDGQLFVPSFLDMVVWTRSDRRNGQDGVSPWHDSPAIGEPTADCSEDAPPVEWEVRLDSGVHDVPLQLAQHSDGGFLLLAGGTMRESDYDDFTWAAKVDSRGEVEWQREFSSWEALGLTVWETEDRGAQILGVPFGEEGMQENILLAIKLDEQGELVEELAPLPVRGSAESANRYAYSPMEGGSFAVVGTTRGPGNADCWIRKLSYPTGLELDTAFGGEGFDEATACSQTADGGFIVVGRSNSRIGWDEPYDVLLAKLDGSGTLQWEKHLGGYNYEHASCVLETADGGFLVVGSTQPRDGANYHELVLIKTGSSGQLEWARRHESVVEWNFASAQQTADSGFIVCTSSPDIGWDSFALWLLKTDELGNCVWSDHLKQDAYGFCVHQTHAGEYAALGIDVSNPENQDLILLKLASGQPAVRQPPIADAGPDRTLVDSDGDSEEEVALDGTGSSDPDGQVDAYIWSEGGDEIARGKRARATLSAGTHMITLEVIDNDGLSARDEVVVTVAATVLSCEIELREHGSITKAEMVAVDEHFDIHVVDSSGGIDQVRFSSDSQCDDLANGKWTDWYEWGTSIGGWDSEHRTMLWSLDSAGEAEVTVEVLQGGATSRCAACTTAISDEVFWAEVVNAPHGRWSIRLTPGTASEDTVLKRVPNSWVLRVIETHADEVDDDGFIWWEVEDTTEGLRGWMAASESSGKQRFLEGDPANAEHQQDLFERAEPTLADTKLERVAIVKEAVESFLGNSSRVQSLYSSNDAGRDGDQNNLSLLAEKGFPAEVILAIVVQETGGTGYSNLDDGVMQIDWEENKGRASSIQCFSAASRYYGNTRQAIFANVKDGLRALRDWLEGAHDDSDAFVISTWKYNGGTFPKRTYCKCMGDPFYLAHIGIRLSGDDLLDGANTCRGCSFTCLQCTEAACLREVHPCGYADTPTIEDFGLSLSPSLAALFKEYQANNVTGAACSPAELRIRDSKGRITGMIDGAPVEQIPHSAFVEGVPIVFVPDDTYTFEAVGLHDGQYSLILSSVSDGVETAFVATDVPTSSGLIHTYDVDWEAIASGDTGVTLMMDGDGDGQPEEAFVVGSNLDGTTLPIPGAQQPTDGGIQPLLYVAVGVALGVLLTVGGLFLLRTRKPKR